MNGYVELHCHSAFSLLDGASTPESLLDRARDLEMPALALTDHDGLYGAPRFALAARQRGIQPLIGAELTLENDRHLLLLAENSTGYANLCWLISRAQLSESKGQARLPFHRLRERADGLIALTGCRNGVLAGPLREGKREEARVTLHELREIFGPRQLYVELQHHLHREDDELNAALAELAGRLPLVATNDVHYATRSHHRLHDVLTCIRQRTTLAEAGRWLRENSEYYLKPASALHALFREHPGALENTLEIAGRCRVALDFRRANTPVSDLAVGQSAEARLAELCWPAMERRYGKESEAARRQLAHELAVIQQTNLAGFFLVVWDIVRFAREQGIRAQGRGSAANSIVAYLLGITRVDPLAHNLLFERFLSAEARVMPDIDIDFCSRRREEVIQYLYNKYGESQVGMVCNFVTYRPRSAVRDVGKALGLPVQIIDQAARALGRWGEDTIEGAVRWALDFPEGLSEPEWEQFLALCQEIQGLPRHVSIHVGGMCITRAPLDEVAPLERATMPGRVVVQWDKEGVEDAGLIKIDLLSLRTLSAVDECLMLIEKTRGQPLKLDAIPLDDPMVYDALQRADTIGAFQVESRAQQQALVQMRPACLSDIVVEVALIRPGPLQGDMVHPFLRRRQGTEPVSYLHPLLEPILAETLGVVIFQEQVIRIAMRMGQFSAGEADMLRRAMSRHRSEEQMEGFRRRFVAGALAQGVPRETAEEVFGKLAGFASFGFCKSHAAAFAQLAYETLYLRAHYPAEYYCALLNNQPMGFYPPRVLVGDARRRGVQILPVHVNQSQAACTIERGAIRLGLSYVDGLGERNIERIVQARQAGSYRDLADFCRRSRLSRVLVENLILAGALDCWGMERRRLIWHVGRLRVDDGLEAPLAEDSPPLAPMTEAEVLWGEYETLGLSAKGQLMETFRERLAIQGVLSSQELEGAREGQRVKVAGVLVIRQAPATAKGFVFLTLEDEWGLINIIVRPDVFQSGRAVWSSGLVLIVEGKVQQAHGRVDVLAERGWKVRI
jgi:error-prone DNA polymerase